jgi:hypothetical protein
MPSIKNGDAARPIRAFGEIMPARSPLLKVCSLLNAVGARYLVIGGQACILHGLVRTTEDVDILIQANEDNCRRVIDALAQLEDGAAAELAPKDLLENVVVKIADEVEVDVSTHAWKVSFEDGIEGSKSIVIEGVTVPYLGLDALLASKETYREQDRIDFLRLQELKKRKE